MAIAAGLGLSAAVSNADVLVLPTGAGPDSETADPQAGDDSDDDFKGGHEFTGRHLLASYSGCARGAINNPPALLAAMEKAVQASGATLLKTVSHEFPGGGFTAIMLLSESHASIHTYPECSACFVDLFTCGHSCSAEAFDRVLREYLRPTHVDRRVLIRDQAAEEDTFRA